MNTLEKLKTKATGKGKMPTLEAIHELLSNNGIEHQYTFNYSLFVQREGNSSIFLRPSDAYYSWNTARFAREILRVLGK